MSNSIKDNLNKNSVISTIRLAIGADIEMKKMFLIVEGDGDIKLWNKMVSNNVSVYKSHGGKEGVKDIIKSHFENQKNVIGICDKDYEVDINDKKIFYYDNCCMEMMLIEKEEPFEQICSEYYNGKLDYNKLKLDLLAQLKCISYIRYNNFSKNLSLKLEGISISKAFNKERKKIDISNIIEQTNKINKNIFKENTSLENEIKEQISKKISYKDLLKITQGHDFTRLFTTYCNEYMETAKINNKDVESSLRCSYRKDDLQTTKLYKQLEHYQDEKKLKIL